MSDHSELKFRRWSENRGVDFTLRFHTVKAIGLSLFGFLNSSFHATPWEVRAPDTHTSISFCAPFGDHPMPIVLTRGSAVVLHSDSCLSVELSQDRTLVRLRSGEALFRVKSDPNWPFVVETGSTSIQDLGTQFDIYRTQTNTRVAVLEGSVQVLPGDTSSKPLTALEELDIPDDAAQPKVRKAITTREFERITAWIDGRVEFEKQTVAEAIREFKRYQHIEVDIKDRRIAELRFTGTFRVTETDRLLQLLKEKCIHSTYDKDAQRITLRYHLSKRQGTACN